MPNKPGFLVIGDINTDIILHADQYPFEGGEAVAPEAELRLGGSGCNTAVALSKLGADTALVGSLSDDPFGCSARDFLKQSTIDQRFIQSASDLQSGFFLILVTPDGQRTMFGSRGANALSPDVEVILSVLGEFSWLHISGYTLIDQLQAQAVLRIAQRARRAGLGISLDPGLHTVRVAQTNLDAIIPLLDLLLISQDELRIFANLQDAQSAARQIIKKGAGAVVVKQGSQGCTYFDEKQSFSQPVRQHASYTIADTTGAGDCFDAGFLFARQEALDIPACLSFANAFAYHSVVLPQGMLAILRDRHYPHTLLQFIGKIELDTSLQNQFTAILENKKS